MKGLHKKWGWCFNIGVSAVRNNSNKDVKFGPANLGLPQLEIDLRSFDALKK